MGCDSRYYESSIFIVFFLRFLLRKGGWDKNLQETARVNSKGKIEEGFRPRRRFVTGAFSQEKRDSFYSRVRHP